MVRVGKGKLSIPKVLGVNHWTTIAMAWVMIILMALEKKGK